MGETPPLSFPIKSIWLDSVGDSQTNLSAPALNQEGEERQRSKSQ